MTDILSEVVHFVGSVTAYTWDWAQFLVPMWLQEIQRPLRYSNFFTGTRKDRDRIRVRQNRILESLRKLYENPDNRPGNQVLTEHELGFREIANIRRFTIWIDDMVEPPEQSATGGQGASECYCRFCVAIDWVYERAKKRLRR